MNFEAPKAVRWTTRAAPVSGRLPKVLVVDDNMNAADAVAAYVELSDRKTLAVYRGIAAIAASHVWRPDLILLDIAMPVMDGFAVAEALRSVSRTSSIILIAFTAFDERFVRKHSAAFAFDGYCQKGATLDHLDAILKKSFA